eukprot:365029-Chlamydomonas_euryale.AAC.17
MDVALTVSVMLYSLEPASQAALSQVAYKLGAVHRARCARVGLGASAECAVHWLEDCVQQGSAPDRCAAPHLRNIGPFNNAASSIRYPFKTPDVRITRAL